MTVNAPETLVLWDVDHTLIENGGVSKETYALTFELLTGRLAVQRPQTDGRTDLLIMRELFESNDIPLNSEHERQLIPCLIQAMQRNEPELRRRGYALPGAASTLVALNEDKTIVQSILTGNIVENARVKLSAFDLDKHLDFEVGGFGSDNLIRYKLVAIAQRKAANKYGTSFDHGSTLIVGDTIRDVEAGLKGGAKVLAVATGVDSEDELQAAGAHRVIANLEDVDAVVDALKELRAR